MDINNIIKLLDAGFTKDDIIKLTAAQPAAEEPTQEPEPIPEVKPVTEPAADPMADLLAEIRGMRADMQKQNINRDALQVSNVDKAVDILGSIINPPTKK